jgi:AraC-like DNA-binding protein
MIHRMDDFASAAMLRVLAAGLAALGLPRPPVPAAGAGARVALADKRSLVAQAAAQAGLAGLLRLGQGLHTLQGDPLHRAFASSPTPQALLRRWSRLERYVHSRHRVVRLADDAHSARLAHRSLKAGAPPLPAEDLVVLGLLVALLQSAGVQGIEARAGQAAAWPTPDERALQAAAATGDTAVWTLRWQPAAGPARPHATASDQEPATFDWPRDWPALARTTATLLAADPMRAWTVAELAREAGLAPRSYQRALAAAGLGHRELAAEARCRRAAAWLVAGEAPLAEIGFVCGWADQAHFTRQFAQRVGLTPGQYREAFAGA